MRGIILAFLVCLALGPYSYGMMQSPEEVTTCNVRVADLARIALDAWLLSPAARGKFTKEEVNSQVKEFAVANLLAEYPLECLQSIEISSRLIVKASSALEHIISTGIIVGKKKSKLFSFSGKADMTDLRSPVS